MVWTLIGMLFLPRAKLDGGSDDFFLSSSFDFRWERERPNMHGMPLHNSIVGFVSGFAKIKFFFRVLRYYMQLGFMIFFLIKVIYDCLWTHNCIEMKVGKSNIQLIQLGLSGTLKLEMLTLMLQLSLKNGLL